MIPATSDTEGKKETFNINNEGKSAPSFCHQVAAWFPDMVRNFYLVKNHKIANNSTITKAGEKINAVLESLGFRNILMHI